MKEVSRIVYFTVGGITILLCLFLSIILVWFLVIVNTKNSEFVVHDTKVTRKLRKVELNPTTDEIFVGSIGTSEIFGEDESMSYVNRDGNHVLISNFGSERVLVCTGSCYCDDFSERRNAAVVSRGLKYLLIAATSIQATTLAHKYFTEQCANEEHKCPSGTSVLSEVEDCDFEEISSEVVDDTKIEDKNQPIEINEEYYWCNGYCLPQGEDWVPFRDESSEKIYKMRSGVNQEQYIQQRKQAYLLRKETCDQWKHDGEVRIYPDLQQKSPEEIYESTMLRPFCEETSQQQMIANLEKMFEVQGEDEPGQKEMSLNRIRESAPELWAICVSGFKGVLSYDNIKCSPKIA